MRYSRQPSWWYRWTAPARGRRGLGSPWRSARRRARRPAAGGARTWSAGDWSWRHRCEVDGVAERDDGFIRVVPPVIADDGRRARWGAHRGPRAHRKFHAALAG